MNNTKHFICDYREHKIWYNEDTDKFTVELLIEDNRSEKVRKSLTDCKKAIDAHIKANLEFKPFQCIRNSWDTSRVVRIEQVRSDGGFVFTYKGEKQTEISDVLEQLKGKKSTYFVYNPDYIEWLEQREAIKQRQQAEIGEHLKLKPELTPLDLSFVNDFKK
jgi:hypothetical protein